MKVGYKKVENRKEFIDAIRLRVDVFIKEQGFEPGWEPDEEDKISRHYMAIIGNEIVSTIRVREIKKGEFKIERMATKRDYRGHGIGKGLLMYVLSQLKKHKPKKIWMQAQAQTQSFYEKCGFKPVSKPVNRWGVLHIDMKYGGF